MPCRATSRRTWRSSTASSPTTSTTCSRPCRSHVADRRKEAERAEAIIASEVERFEARLSTLDVVPTIVSLQDHLETIRQAEIDRVRGRLGQLTPEQEMAVEALTRGIINKVMHTPITTLKTAAQGIRGHDGGRCGAPPVQPAGDKDKEARRARASPRTNDTWRSQRRRGQLMALLRIGSRGSQLALWQANHISALLRARGHEVEIEIIHTTGDKITDVALAKVGTKGMFTKEIEEALAAGRVDLAVHSLKDLPTELPAGFEIAAITERARPARRLLLAPATPAFKTCPRARASAPPACAARRNSRPSAPISTSIPCAATSTRACANSSRENTTPSSSPPPD